MPFKNLPSMATSEHHIFETQDLKNIESLNKPSSSLSKTNVLVVRQKVTIFDPVYKNDILSPEEDTNAYLEDYLENLGEYRVPKGTVPKRLQCNSNTANNALSGKDFNNQPKECIKLADQNPEGTNKTKEKDISEQIDKENQLSLINDIRKCSKNKPRERSFDLPELKSCDAKKERKNPVTSSSQQTSSICFAAKAKEVQTSLNVTKTITPKKVHVRSPKRPTKRSTSECEDKVDLQIETIKLFQDIETSNPAKGGKDTISRFKEAAKGVCKEETNQQIASDASKPKSFEQDPALLIPDSSKKKISTTKNSPKPARKGPRSKSTMHSFFEAFM